MDIQNFITLVATGEWQIGVRTENGCERAYSPVKRMALKASTLFIAIHDGPMLALRIDLLHFDGTNSSIRIKASREYRFQWPRSFGSGVTVTKPGKTLFKIRRTDAKLPKATRIRSPFEQAFDNYLAEKG